MKATKSTSTKSTKSAAIDNEKAIEAAALAQQVAKDKAAAEAAHKAMIEAAVAKANAEKLAAELAKQVSAGVTVFESLRPEFKKTTIAWLFGDLSGANAFSARVAEVRVIASALLSKGEALPLLKDGKLDKDKLKAWRKSFNALSNPAKAIWEAKALPLFKAALNDYHVAMKPLKKAVFANDKFAVKSLRVTVGKKTGNVSVTSRHVANGSDL